MSAGISVRLFLADGTPGGLLTAEIMNWTGHVVAAPRSELAALLKRPELGRTGIYLLLGDDPDSPGSTRAYIGEGDDVSTRLRQHARSEQLGGKDFWNRAVVLTSKDANLTKAHARYLEARLLSIAAEARRGSLLNGTAPLPLPLPESDVSDMEYFINQVKIVLPVLGVNLLRSTSQPITPSAGIPPSAIESPVFILSSKAGAAATAQEIDGEFTVRAGSRARRQWIGTETSYKKLRIQLEVDGTLRPVEDDLYMEFPEDYVSSSPSAASAVILGRNSNGRLEWKVQDTLVSYGDWQSRELEASGAA